MGFVIDLREAFPKIKGGHFENPDTPPGASHCLIVCDSCKKGRYFPELLQWQTNVDIICTCGKTIYLNSSQGR